MSRPAASPCPPEGCIRIGASPEGRPTGQYAQGCVPALMRRWPAETYAESMTRVRAVTAVLTGLTVLAVVAGIVTAVKLPAGSC